jgi:hypothetical protein
VKDSELKNSLAFSCKANALPFSISSDFLRVFFFSFPNSIKDGMMRTHIDKDKGALETWKANLIEFYEKGWESVEGIPVSRQAQSGEAPKPAKETPPTTTTSEGVPQASTTEAAEPVVNQQDRILNSAKMRKKKQQKKKKRDCV